MEMNKVLAWHFLPEDGKIAHRNRRKVEVGKTYSCKGKIDICWNGMHGSRRILDALEYVNSTLVERVEIWGDIVEQTDKLCGRHRKCLALGDITNILHEFACDVAEDALKAHKVKDKRSWAAIEAKRKWLKGEISDDDLDAAWAAAWAASDAARDAAGDAAWAAARAATRAAAGAAARAAARDAARDAAWDAARDAARDAASDAARDAAWDKYNTMLEERVLKALGENDGRE